MPVRTEYKPLWERIAQNIMNNEEYTNDIADLNLYENQYIFVYGTLKRGCKRNELLANAGARFSGVAVSSHNNYDLLYTQDGKFPVLFENTGDKTRAGKIKGELWLVPTSLIQELDIVEANGTCFDRVERSFASGNNHINAWVYLGVKSFWNTVDLNEVIMVRSNNQLYHHYHDLPSGVITKNKPKEGSLEVEGTTHPTVQ